MGQAPSLIIGTEEYEGKSFMHQGGEDVLDDCEYFNQNEITHVVGVCHRSVGSQVLKGTKLTPDAVSFFHFPFSLSFSFLILFSLYLQKNKKKGDSSRSYGFHNHRPLPSL